MENRFKILIVEDDVASQKLAHTILKNLGEIDIAPDGISAIELAKKNDYALILLDVNLGLGMSGLETLSELRNSIKYKNTPIVALTAYAMHSDKEEFLSRGFSFYLSKPYLKEDLLRLVNSILNA